MTEIALRDTTPSLPEKIEYCKAMAGSNLLPGQYRNNPANLLFALEYADALGLKPIHAITGIDVIDGKPSASADLIAATVRRAGHKLRVSGDDTYAVAQIIRADDPSYTYEARWDMGKARQADLAGKGSWKKYPAALLRSRAITEVARMGASDALYGVIYTPEELGAVVDGSGAPVAAVEPVRDRSSVSRLRAAVPPAEPAPEPEPAPPVDVSPDVDPRPEDRTDAAMITPAQLTKLGATFTDFGITDRDQRLAVVTVIVGRTVNSSKELTKAEASDLIDSLDTIAAGANPQSALHALVAGDEA